MFLPESAALCIRTLESAGYQAYAVGGCVRDDLLGIVPHDYDLCTDALPEEIQAAFAHYPLILNGLKHGTVSVVTEEGVIEITTFRTEGDYTDNRHPGWVTFVPDIRQDLARRDFTINAMAYSPTRGYADPFGGREDLKAGILRAVGDPRQRFREDSLRILRGVRFAVRFRLALDPDTEAAMNELAPLMDNLARERVLEELSRLLPLVTVEDLVRFSGILSQVIPELKPLVGFDQHSPHHAYDIYTHTAHVVQNVPAELTIRWAALLHDIGKVPTFTRDATGRGHFYGHAQAGAEMADAVLHRLKASTQLREDVVWLIDRHMLRLVPERKLLRRYLSRFGSRRLHDLLLLQQADMGSKGTGKDESGDNFPRVAQLLEEIEAENACLTLKDLAVNGRDLMALGYSGKAIGEALELLLEQVVDEALPNERGALLDSLRKV